MKKVVSVVGVLLMCGCCFLTPKQNIPEAPKVIIETVRITPKKYFDPVDEIKKEVRHTQNWNVGISDTTIQITQADAEMLMKIAWSEAGNQGVEGQKKIMMVVWNRKNNPDFPDTVYGVISQPGQFDSFTNGRYNIATPTYETHMALSEFEKNISYEDDLYAFETKENGRTLTRWFDVAYTYKNHTFYTLKKH